MDKIIIEDNIPEPDYLSTRPGVQKIDKSYSYIEKRTIIFSS